ncbi:hypothetical protein [Bacillus suaedaesalsae]|uniref:DUF304 domain-containing protein n=1 Tax=Bacillus suaedaesalsae TaxID=2810349 RepID=A0ABS2DDN5_9BACI|nr:hypothetical protein [Bacillus suaedaesalsae]MBM6616564.1 hypothetical protein [Bacillus suaedaesalsae]
MLKMYSPSTEGTIKLMFTIFILVLTIGSVIHLLNQASYENWMIFFKMSSLYVGVCLLIFLSIKSQRIILRSNKLIFIQLGFTRYSIPLEMIKEVRKGKLNGSPIMEVETHISGHLCIARLPYFPFEKDWDEILGVIKETCGHEVIGEMTLVRNKGEIRTWME